MTVDSTVVNSGENIELSIIDDVEDEFVRNNVRIDRLFRIDHGQIKMEK